MPSLAYENAQSRHRYILDLFESHTDEVASLQERSLSSLLPTIAQSLSLSERGIARARAYLANDPVTTFRFLRRWKYDEDAAAAALEKTLTWRLESDLDLLWSSSLEPEYTERPLFFFHPQLKDRFGRPCGVLNLKEVRRTEDGSLDGLKEFIAWAWEVARRWLADLSVDAMPSDADDGPTEDAKQRPEPKVQLSVIVDLKDAGMSNLEMELLPYFMDLLKNHFPGMVGTIFILHYSWIYGGMWQVAKRILPSQALDRIIFPSSNDELLAFFDPANLLVQHGGKVEYDYSLRNNEIFQRFGRPVHHPTPTSSSSLLPAISLSRSSSSPSLSRRSSFESIHDVFFSAAATPSTSQPTTPPADSVGLPAGLTSRPSWLSMTSLPAAGGGAGLGEAIRRNQRKKGRRRAHADPKRTSDALGLSLGEPSASTGAAATYAEADATPAHSSDDDDDPETALVEDAVGLARSDSLRDFRLHLPRGTRDLSSGPPSSDSSSSSTITAATNSRPGSRHSSRVSSRAVSREPSPRRTFFSPWIGSRGFEAANGDSTVVPRHERKRDLLRTLSYLAALRVLALNRELRWQLALVLGAVEQTFRLRKLASLGHRVTARIGGFAQEVREEEQNTRARRKGVKWVEGEKGDRDVHPRSSRHGNSLVTSASHRRAARLSSHPPSSSSSSAAAAHATPEISSSVRAIALVFVFLVVRSTWFVSFVESLVHLALAPGRMLVSAERRAADAVASTAVFGGTGGAGAGAGAAKPRRRKRDWVLARVGLRLP